MLPRKRKMKFRIRVHSVRGVPEACGEAVVVCRRNRKSWSTSVAAVGAGGEAQFESDLAVSCALFKTRSGYQRKPFVLGLRAVGTGDDDDDDLCWAEVDLAAYADAAAGQREAVPMTPSGHIVVTVRALLDASAGGTASAPATLHQREGSHGRSASPLSTARSADGDGSNFDLDESDEDTPRSEMSQSDGPSSYLDEDYSYSSYHDDEQPGSTERKEAAPSVSSEALDDSERAAVIMLAKRASRVELEVRMKSGGKLLGTVRVRPAAPLSRLRKILSSRIKRLPAKFGFFVPETEKYVSSSAEATMAVSDIVAQHKIFVYDVFRG